MNAMPSIDRCIWDSLASALYLAVCRAGHRLVQRTAARSAYGPRDRSLAWAPYVGSAGPVKPEQLPEPQGVT